MNNRSNDRRRLPGVVKRLGAVSFLNDLASEMVYPLLPALVTTRLGAGAIALGALDGIADAVAAGVKLASGWLADRVRWRRPLVVGGYAAAALVRPLIGLASAAWQVIALRGTDRLGKGVRTPPRDAVIADAVEPAMSGRAFGFHRAMDHAGAMIGPLIAWVLIVGADMTPAAVIMSSIVPGLLAVLVVAWAMRRVGRVVGATVRPAGARVAADAGPASGPAGLFVLIVVFALARVPETLFLLRLQDLGVAIAVVPLLWSALHVVRTSASYPGGQLADAIGPRVTMVAGWLLYAAVCWGLAVSKAPVAGALWFLGLGFVTALTESPERVFVALKSARRGRGFGIYHASVGLAALPGGLILGGIYAVHGGPTALAVSAIVATTLAIPGVLLRDRAPNAGARG